MNLLTQEHLLEKWEETGLLGGLELDQKEKMANLLENHSKYLLNEADQAVTGIEEIATYTFPLIRRIFGDGQLDFTWDITTSPVFETVKHRGPSPPFETSHHAVKTSLLKTRFYSPSSTTLDPEEEKKQNFYNMDSEVELVSILSDALRDEFNEKFKNKHVVFYTPIIVARSTEMRVEAPVVGVHEPKSKRSGQVRATAFDEGRGLMTRYRDFDEKIELV
jgi:hypothetical protein